MKPMLKAPGTKRLKLSYDKPPSITVFKCKLRRYTAAANVSFVIMRNPSDGAVVGRCRLTL